MNFPADPTTLSKNVILMRGVPSSGKSYLANQINQLYPDSLVCNADFYLYLFGEYFWTQERAGMAHRRCENRFQKALTASIPLVIVDNVNFKYKACRPYLETAKEFGYTVFLKESEAPWRYNAEECFKRNSHGVPLTTIKSVLERFQPNKIIKNYAKENLGIDIHILPDGFFQERSE